MLGVYADELNKVLWVCSNKFGDTGEATSLKNFPSIFGFSAPVSGQFSAISKSVAML